MRASLGPVLVSALFVVLVPVTMLRAKPLWKGVSDKAFNSHPELVPNAVKQGLSTEGIRCQVEEEGLEEFTKPWFLQQGDNWMAREQLCLPVKTECGS